MRTNYDVFSVAVRIMAANRWSVTTWKDVDDHELCCAQFCRAGEDGVGLVTRTYKWKHGPENLEAWTNRVRLELKEMG
jgi:hypothetical protein